jgi:hypothetical protein
LKDGDFAPAANGRPYRVGGTEEKFQRAAVRLTVPRGSFCCDPALGSRMSSLTGTEVNPSAAALTLAQEALRSVPGVTASAAEYVAADRIVKITLECDGTEKTVEVKL